MRAVLRRMWSCRPSAPAAMIWTLVLFGAALFLGASLVLALILTVVVMVSVTGLNTYDAYRRREPAVDAGEADGR